MRICVYVVDVASVNADGGEDACIRIDARIAGENFSVVKEDGTAGVTAFDRAVEIVPLIDRANRSRGILDFVEIGKRFAESDFSGKCKCAIKNTAFVLCRDEEAVLFVYLDLG